MKPWRILDAALFCAVLAALPVAAAELHVAMNNPAAVDSGDGSAAKPYRTISYAMRQLKPGDHLFIHQGVYRDAILFPAKPWGQASETVVEGAPGEEVWLEGADPMTGWQPVRGGVFSLPFAVEPQQVFVNGKSLRQVGGSVFGGYPVKPGNSLAAVLPGQGGIWPQRLSGDQRTMPLDSFYYAADSRVLYIRVNLASLAGARVEGSVRPYLVLAQNASNLTLRHLNFRHANNSTAGRQGAVTMSGTNLRIQDIHVVEADSVGIEVSGKNIEVANSSFDRCGQLGLKARGENIRLIGNQTNGNNTRGFNKWWEAGGAKFVGEGGLRNSLISRHVAVGNNGDGIWFDWQNTGNTVQQSVLAYNQGFGLQYEASDTATIQDNFVYGNGQRGIYLPHSSGSVVKNNLVFLNGLEGIVVIDEGRRDPANKYDLTPRNDHVAGNVVAWNLGAVILPVNKYGSLANCNLYLGGADQTWFSEGWPKSSRFKLPLAGWQAVGQDVSSKQISEAPDAALLRQITDRSPTAHVALMQVLSGRGLQALPAAASCPVPLDLIGPHPSSQ